MAGSGDCVPTTRETLKTDWIKKIEGDIVSSRPYIKKKGYLRLAWTEKIVCLWKITEMGNVEHFQTVEAWRESNTNGISTQSTDADSDTCSQNTKTWI